MVVNTFTFVMAWEHYVLEICFGLAAVITNVYFFHYLDRKVENRLWVLLTSLCSAHVLSGCTIISLGVLVVAVDSYFECAVDVLRLKTCMLLLSAFLMLLHVFSVLVKDVMYVIEKIPPEDNLLLIMLPWFCTSVVALMLGLLDDRGVLQVAYAVALVILVSDILMLIVYAYLSRKSQDKDNDDDWGYISIKRNFFSLEGMHPGHIGYFLAISYVVFTIPFVVERLVYQQNAVVSTICITLISISQGLNFIQSIRPRSPFSPVVDV